MPDNPLDLGTGDAVAGAVVAASYLTCDGGLVAAVTCGAAVAASYLTCDGGLRGRPLFRLPGALAAADGVAVGGVVVGATLGLDLGSIRGSPAVGGAVVSAELSGCEHLALTGAAAGGAVVAATLERSLPLVGCAIARTVVTGQLWPGLRASVVSGGAHLFGAPLSLALGLAGAAVSGAVVAASLGRDRPLTGDATSGAVVSNPRLGCLVPLTGHAGSPGWERPQLAGAAVAGAAVSASLTICGVPNVHLTGAA